WLYGDFGCQYYAFMGFLMGIANLTTLLMIALDRYLVTCCQDLPTTIIIPIFIIIAIYIHYHHHSHLPPHVCLSSFPPSSLPSGVLRQVVGPSIEGEDTFS
ncbi:hypothetical protein Pcinc_001516, partial [Petrolisthes cinctipes]